MRDRRSGGAGTAIALALMDRGIAELRIWDLDPARAASLRDRLAASSSLPVSVCPPGESDDIAINASSAGMSDPFDPGALRTGALVCDAIMKPPVTRLLSEARKMGHPIQEGRHMLDFQVSAIWDFFDLGTEPTQPPRHILSENPPCIPSPARS